MRLSFFDKIVYNQLNVVFMRIGRKEVTETYCSKNRPGKFSHSTEETFSKVLDFYGITWEYEPRTFALEHDSSGHVTEAFAPDFYLPAQDLYIELTTLRPQLSTHKNQKLKRLQELYPEIKIKLLKRREMREMLVKYGLYQEADQLQGRAAQNE
jgi:hypothetical protein